MDQQPPIYNLPIVHPSVSRRSSSWVERTFGFKAWHFAGALLGVILVALYISRVLVGNASLEVLMEIEQYESHLKQEISRLKEENAALQKSYFELKELQPTE